MSERKTTRGRQRIPIKLIGNKDDLLVSFSKRRVGIYKKASELSTLCAVDVGAIIFSPSGVPHSFFTPDFDSVVYGRRRDADIGSRDCSRLNILELNARLDGMMEQQEREEEREKQLESAAVGGNAAEMGWWEVSVDGLSVEEVKEQMEWFKSLKAQIKARVEEIKNDEESPPLLQDGDGGGVAAGCFFAPLSLDGYDGGGGGSSHVGDEYHFPPPPPPPLPPYFDVGCGSSFAVIQHVFPPPLHPFDLSGGGGGSEQYYLPPPSLNLF